jgi:anti-sigma regulatory factor (Ser/Thr protein kinase)
MTPMAPTRPNRPTRTARPPLTVSQHQCRIPLMADLAAAAEARAVVEDAIRMWRVPVDADVAVLLTSELVTNAVTHGTAVQGTFVLLTIACDAAVLRVDVHDGSGDLPVLDTVLLNTGLLDTGLLDTALLDEAQAEAETGRGLLLVTSLSTEWGFYHTPAGKAVYFTLELQRDLHETVIDAPNGRGSRSVS